MIDLNYSIAATKPRRAPPPVYLSVVAAIAFSSTLPTCCERPSFRRLEAIQGQDWSSTANFDIDTLCDSASTRPRAFTLEEAANALEKLLASNGFRPSRSDRTTDGSVLFQFLGKMRACVDLYPHGELIVVVRQSSQDEIHELQFEDSEQMIRLLRDAHVAS